MNHSHDKRTNVLIVDQPFDADGNETPAVTKMPPRCTVLRAKSVF